MGVVTLHGSSSMCGVGDLEGGLNARLWREYNYRREVLSERRDGVWQFATTGERIATTLAKYRTHVVDDIRLRDARVLSVFDLGWFDCSFPITKRRNQTPMNIFKPLLQELCEVVYTMKEQRGDRFNAQFHGMTPLKYTSTLLDGSDVFHEADRREYENEVRITARSYGFEYLDQYDLCGGSNAYNEGYVSADGVHPSTKVFDVKYVNVLRAADETFAGGNREVVPPQRGPDNYKGGVIIPSQQDIAEISLAQLTE